MLTLNCEVQSGSGWKKVDIEYGLAHKGESMRCLECHGRVVPMKQYSTGAKPISNMSLRTRDVRPKRERSLGIKLSIH